MGNLIVFKFASVLRILYLLPGEWLQNINNKLTSANILRFLYPKLVKRFFPWLVLSDTNLLFNMCLTLRALSGVVGELQGLLGSPKSSSSSLVSPRLRPRLRTASRSSACNKNKLVLIFLVIYSREIFLKPHKIVFVFFLLITKKKYV